MGNILTGRLITLREVKFCLGTNADAGDQDVSKSKVWLARVEGGRGRVIVAGWSQGRGDEDRRGTNVPDISYRRRSLLAGEIVAAGTTRLDNKQGLYSPVD